MKVSTFAFIIAAVLNIALIPYFDLQVYNFLIPKYFGLAAIQYHQMWVLLFVVGLLSLNLKSNTLWDEYTKTLTSDEKFDKNFAATLTPVLVHGLLVPYSWMLAYVIDWAK